MLESIVTSLQFNNHSRWGIQPSQERVQALIMGFLDWMRESKEWTRLESEWRESDGPWSLPLCLSRAYLRHRDELQHHHHEEEPSHSAARALLELPTPLHTAGIVTDAILDAFASLTHHLPYSVRLSYQLHLEGLLEDEIAALTGASPKAVARHIREAKEHLQQDIVKRSSGA